MAESNNVGIPNFSLVLRNGEYKHGDGVLTYMHLSVIFHFDEMPPEYLCIKFSGKSELNLSQLRSFTDSPTPHVHG